MEGASARGRRRKIWAFSRESLDIQAMVRHVDVDAAAAVLTEEAERRIALQDRLFPKPERALLGFVARDELPNMLEQIERPPGVMFAKKSSSIARPKIQGVTPS